MSRNGVARDGEHGGNVVAVALALGVDPGSILDLSASLNPLAPDVAAVAAEHLDTLSRYPDEAALSDATEALASAIAVPAARLLITNGASEAIALVAAEHPLGVVEHPEFSLYERHLRGTGARRWRSNPNNPLGMVAGASESAFVWDESFWPLATGTWTRGDDDSYRIGSLTKLWHCPGLRVGYVIAPTVTERDALAARQPMWSVNALALALVPSLLARTDLPAWAAGIAGLRARVAKLFTTAGFIAVESAANWVLVHEAASLREPLARHGVLVRDCANFGLDGTIRVAVPPADSIDRLTVALAASLSDVTP